MPATAPRPLTKRQSLILCAIVKHIADHGYPPSIRDLCDEFGIRSPQGIRCHLNALRAKGVLSWTQKTKTRAGKAKSPPEARSFVVAGLGDRIKDAALLHLRELATRG